MSRRKFYRIVDHNLSRRYGLFFAVVVVMTDLPRRSSTRTKKHTATLDEIQDIIWVLLTGFFSILAWFDCQAGRLNPLRKGDLVAFTAPDDTWIGRVMVDTSPETHIIEVGWPEVHLTRTFVSFSGGNDGEPSKQNRHALLGPLKDLLTQGTLNRDVYNKLIDLGALSFEASSSSQLVRSNYHNFMTQLSLKSMMWYSCDSLRATCN